MYQQANDNELIYLIKEGNSLAYQILYKKYEHLIYKIYKKNIEVRGVMLSDFMQEGLMCLEQAIHTYQEKYKCSFYSYFYLILRRNNSKLFRTDGLKLKERYTDYKKESFFNSNHSKSPIVELVIRELKFDGELEKDLFYECILNSVKITEIAKKYGMNYTTVYTKHKKIKQKIEKILTNVKV
ncbi:MAG: sigma-70 family RNA polymerase sigma factor [Anaeroplasmataceae bacterium]|nr:sigma-70 family RNA polymerase sigma factor [Anaeroplasmataceae bacterium]MDE6241917.1 sigma-70 family RNA polymerase sigma factor [Anaeroplasmataceae bacterium]